MLDVDLQPTPLVLSVEYKNERSSRFLVCSSSDSSSARRPGVLLQWLCPQSSSAVVQRSTIWRGGDHETQVCFDSTFEVSERLRNMSSCSTFLLTTLSAFDATDVHWVLLLTSKLDVDVSDSTVVVASEILLVEGTLGMPSITSRRQICCRAESDTSAFMVHIVQRFTRVSVQGFFQRWCECGEVILSGWSHSFCCLQSVLAFFINPIVMCLSRGLIIYYNDTSSYQWYRRKETPRPVSPLSATILKALRFVGKEFLEDMI